MSEVTVSRTLVKSAPELWSECSDAASLARHLGAFGEIRITKLEPETAVAWEGAAIRGTVRLEPSGWGTRVVLTATGAGTDMSDLSDESESSGESGESGESGASGVSAAEETEEPLVPAPAPMPRGRLRRMFLRWSRRRDTEPALSTATPEPADIPAAVDAITPAAGALDEALDSLGRAHHRPYSRA